MSYFFVSSIMHIFLKAYLSFRGKIFKLYTFSCSPPTPLSIKIKIKKKKRIICVLVKIFFFIHIIIICYLKINDSTGPCL